MKAYSEPTVELFEGDLLEFEPANNGYGDDTGDTGTGFNFRSWLSGMR